MLRSLVGSEMCIRDRYQRRVRGFLFAAFMALAIFLCLVAALAGVGRGMDGSEAIAADLLLNLPDEAQGVSDQLQPQPNGTKAGNLTSQSQQQHEEEAPRAGVEQGFDWGGECGDSGSGSFEQDIVEGAQVEVGVLPAGKQAILVHLRSEEDIDLRLYEADGEERNLVGWPAGVIAGHGLQSLRYRGSLIKWSGYNGVNGKLGHEYIQISGADLAADMRLFAFGYKSGKAVVEYSYMSPPCTKSFSLAVQDKEIKVLGLIPAGLRDVRIELQAAQDVDIQLQEDRHDRRLVVGWPGGALNWHRPERKVVGLSNGIQQDVSYSGYNGNQYQDGKGNEWIELHNLTAAAFEMRVFGYAAGTCTVIYSWRTQPAAPPRQGKIIKIDMLPLANRQDKARKVFLYRDVDPAHGRLIIRRGSYATIKLWVNVALTGQHELAVALNSVNYDHRHVLTNLGSCSNETSAEGKWAFCLAGTEVDNSQFVHLSLIHI
eukprot:TRINITY_DN16483_c0_g1_i4.p1 TRINITY_DN16483_c0_g1~~TRINITY_DN16483_c0_g1_i4.p1  ORF type:complete len:487 (-),score=154.67 TRINITY_DN16483_c0_g1_i4:108-1568(-)